MPLAGTGTILGDEMLAAVDAVAASILAELEGRAPTTAEAAENRKRIFHALGNAIVAHVIANAVVTGSATGVTTGAAAVPVVGTVL